MNKQILSLICAGVVFVCGCSTVEKGQHASAFPDQIEILSRLKKYPLKPYFPPASDRKSWTQLPEELRKQLIEQGEKSLTEPWANLTARDYMLFRRAGNRKAYEDPMFQRRTKLISLVVAECCEYSGRFTDQIIEGIWQTISEPVWCLPAHEGLEQNDPLPDPARFKIDLFNAATGNMLADILQILEPELAKVSPMLVKRVKSELMRRLIEPAEKLNDKSTWWFSGRNNWTPWCASNLSSCAIYLLNDQPERLAKFLNTYLTISRRFYEKYPADGGCNEGPSYWRHAVGKYIQHLDILDRRLQLEGRLFKDKKLEKMSEYPAGMNLYSNVFLSTSDSSKGVNIAPGFLRFVTKRVRAPQLSALATRMKPEELGRASELNNYLIDIFGYSVSPKIKNTFAEVNFWPNMGLAILREKPDSPEIGTILSLKGGHNAESHNHNDLGHFTLTRDGQPLIVDVGVGIYTAQTFSAKRFEIWNLGAQGHNQPRFSGKMQEAGAQYKATLAMPGNDAVIAELDQAYPDAAGVRELNRRINLNRMTGAVEVIDTAKVSGRQKVEITLYTAVKPERFTLNQVEWQVGILWLSNLKIVKVTEELRLDAKLKETWGRLWRIDLAGEIRSSGRWKMTFDFEKSTHK